MSHVLCTQSILIIAGLTWNQVSVSCVAWLMTPFNSTEVASYLMLVLSLLLSIHSIEMCVDFLTSFLQLKAFAVRCWVRLASFFTLLVNGVSVRQVVVIKSLTMGMMWLICHDLNHFMPTAACLASLCLIWLSHTLVEVRVMLWDSLLIVHIRVLALIIIAKSRIR